MLLRIFSKFRFSPKNRFFATTNSIIEEEYFEDFESTEPVKIQKTSTTKIPEILENSGNYLEEIIGALTDQRAKDLFVVKTEAVEMTPYSHKIICSAFNSRQAAAISENLRFLLKLDKFSSEGGPISHSKRVTKRSNGWYVSEIENVQIHVMSEDCREKYDLEAVWAGDDRILEDVENEKMKFLLPPKK